MASTNHERVIWGTVYYLTQSTTFKEKKRNGRVSHVTVQSRNIPAYIQQMGRWNFPPTSMWTRKKLPIWSVFSNSSTSRFDIVPANIEWTTGILSTLTTKDFLGTGRHVGGGFQSKVFLNHGKAPWNPREIEVKSMKQSSVSIRWKSKEHHGSMTPMNIINPMKVQRGSLMHEHLDLQSMSCWKPYTDTFW